MEADDGAWGGESGHGERDGRGQLCMYVYGGYHTGPLRPTDGEGRMKDLKGESDIRQTLIKPHLGSFHHLFCSL